MTLLRSFTAVCDELDRREHVTLGLERVEALLELLDHPERALHTVQVVGTNGKGTTASALAAALETAGHPSGAYLSPHVLSYTERVAVRGKQVSEERFAETMEEIMNLSDKSGIGASQFEILTAGALEMFREAGLSWAVLEAGLGARHDATAAAEPEAVVLTNVGLEHMEYLGGTVEEISREKLACLHHGSTLVLGADDPRVLAVARERCAEVGSALVEVGAERGSPGSAAPYEVHNVLVGLRAAEALLGRTLGAGEREAARRARTALPARFEVHEVDGVPVVVDGGHNPSGLAAALEAVRSVYGGRPLGVVFGALRDKDIGSMLATLNTEADALVLTRPASERAADPEWIGREHGPRDRFGKGPRVAAGAVEALREAAGLMREAEGVVLVTGSLYTGAPVLEWLS